jgi:ubiquinone/menaquinone biosynthesis C-methylase UbiE
MLGPAVSHTLRERHQAILHLLKQVVRHDLKHLRLLEVGCGSGIHLLEFLRMGFAPQHLAGVEMRPERLALAQRVLPPTIKLHGGDACFMDIAPHSMDIVFQATVFSSLPDTEARIRLAETIWPWVKPGGGVLWYDRVVNDTRQPEVRGLPMRHIRRLFPQAQLESRRVTLAPPLAQTVCRISPHLYPLLNAIPQLRTHALVWIGKAF